MGNNDLPKLLNVSNVASGLTSEISVMNPEGWWILHGTVSDGIILFLCVI